MFFSSRQTSLLWLSCFVKHAMSRNSSGRGFYSMLPHRSRFQRKWMSLTARPIHRVSGASIFTQGLSGAKGVGVVVPFVVPTSLARILSSHVLTELRPIG